MVWGHAGFIRAKVSFALLLMTSTMTDMSNVMHIDSRIFCI
jgi:hypothetical protein